MSYLTDIHTVGGNEGNYFDFSGTNGATLKTLWVWVGPSQIKAITVWFTDDRYAEFGKKSRIVSKFTFEDGERFTSLSLWGNGIGTRLGAIKFKTNQSREFFVQMTDWPLITEFPVDIGSGICVGLVGCADSDINNMGFKFINTIKSTVMKDVQYPTLHSVIPQVAVEELKYASYKNDTSETQEYTIETTKKITTTSSWSVTNKIETTFKIEVSAGIPEVMDVSTGFAFTVGSESSYGLEHSEEKTEKMSYTVKVPPRKTVDVKITIGRATVDLPYTGTVRITCTNGGVLEFPTSETYKGITYTKAMVVVNES